MKTTTIFNAYMLTIAFDSENGSFEKQFRRLETFRSALLRRMEDGDRAREALSELADNWYSLDSDEGASIIEEFEQRPARYIVVMTHRPDGWKSQLQQEFTSYAQAELAAQQLMQYVPDEYRDYEVQEIETN